tara:strand:- start:4467 stop:4880 length:414 start_codon:yes stop_codon:yes gene_type:complete
MRFKVKNFPTGTINKTSVFRKNLRKALKDRKYTIEKFAEIVDMSMGKIQRFQNPLQKGTISLEDAIKVSSTLNISLEEMCGIEHVKFEPRQTRALRDYLTKQKSEKARYFRAIEKDQAQEREILSYLDGILSNTNTA